MRSAVVLLSGGLDSMVCAGIARERGFAVVALTVDYNQRHRVELDAARAIAAQLADRHILLPLDLRAFGGSALTSDIAVPKAGVGAGICCSAWNGGCAMSGRKRCRSAGKR